MMYFVFRRRWLGHPDLVDAIRADNRDQANARFALHIRCTFEVLLETANWSEARARIMEER